MRRTALIIAVVLAVVGLALALLPFGRPGLAGGNTTDAFSRDCSPPIVSAWRTENLSGSFVMMGPSPGPPHIALPYCRPTARTRLAYAGGLWLATALVLLARRKQWPPRNALPGIAPA